MTGQRFYHLCGPDTAPMDVLLEAACEARGVGYEGLWAPHFDCTRPPRPAAGDLLYRSETTSAAILAEQLLWRPDIATFYASKAQVFCRPYQPQLLFERSGLPTPRTVYSLSARPKQLRRDVAALGGFPLVVKVPGGEGGVGVMQVDSLPALLSLADFLRGAEALLMELVAPAVHWRVIVVGDQARCAYRNFPQADDFRSAASAARADYLELEAVPRALAALALRASEVLGLGFAGVDLLEADAGRLLLLEANFPCYWPHAQEEAGFDIAGSMLDALQARARLSVQQDSGRDPASSSGP